jgi:hypothetical protein
MNARPATDDLAPGVQLAGMSETPASADSNPTQLVAQVATFGTGTLAFADPGHVVPVSTSNGWIVADFGSFQRGYTRLSVDAKTGAELWAFAPWTAGGPAIVQSTMMVKPNAAAGFGGRNAAVHDWESGLFGAPGGRLPPMERTTSSSRTKSASIPAAAAPSTGSCRA